MALTVVDAGVIIGLLDGQDAHHVAARAALAAARDRGDDLVLPAAAYAEILVAPNRHGRGAVETVDGFLDALPIRVEPIDRATAARAAELRAAHASVRLPDALVIATALVVGADRLLTTDRRWPDVGVLVEYVTGSAPAPEPRLPLFASEAPDLAEHVDEALGGFGER